MRGLKDKNVLITGGASGIGKATAIRFLEEKSNVVILDNDEKSCVQIAEEQPELSAVITADVSDFNSVEQAFEKLDHIFAQPDILINNAGISIRHRFLEISAQEWQNVINVNLNGIFYAAQHSAK